jgi:hypothetical protein
MTNHDTLQGDLTIDDPARFAHPWLVARLDPPAAGPRPGPSDADQLREQPQPGRERERNVRVAIEISRTHPPLAIDLATTPR